MKNKHGLQCPISKKDWPSWYRWIAQDKRGTFAYLKEPYFVPSKNEWMHQTINSPTTSGFLASVVHVSIAAPESENDIIQHLWENESIVSWESIMENNI